MKYTELLKPLLYFILTSIFFLILSEVAFTQGLNLPESGRGGTAAGETNGGGIDPNSPDFRDYRNVLDIRKQTKELYSSWLKLAIVGKDQNEIEEFYNEVDPEVMAGVKESLRSRVIYRLKRRGLHTRGRKFSDIDDLRASIRIIEQELRNVSLESDSAIRYKIKETFDINPFTLNDLAYQIQ